MHLKAVANVQKSLKEEEEEAYSQQRIDSPISLTKNESIAYIKPFIQCTVNGKSIGFPVTGRPLQSLVFVGRNGGRNQEAESIIRRNRTSWNETYRA